MNEPFDKNRLLMSTDSFVEYMHTFIGDTQIARLDRLPRGETRFLEALKCLREGTERLYQEGYDPRYTTSVEGIVFGYHTHFFAPALAFRLLAMNIRTLALLVHDVAASIQGNDLKRTMQDVAITARGMVLFSPSLAKAEEEQQAPARVQDSLF